MTRSKWPKLPPMMQKSINIFRGLNYSIILLGALFIAISAVVSLHSASIFELQPILFKILSRAILVVTTYLVALVFVRLTASRVVKLFEESVELEQKLLLTKLYSAIVFLIATIIALWELGVTASNITIFVGFVATGIALSIRDVITSYLVWFILLTKRPFRIGDYIKIGDDEGRVLHIGTFFVLIDDSPERPDDYVRIPNRIFLEKPVANFGKTDVPLVVKIPITDQKILKAVESGVKSAVKREVSIRLSCEAEKWYAVVECRSSLEENKVLRDAILRAALPSGMTKA